MATLGAITKPMLANTFTTGSGANSLAPLQGQDLQDMLMTHATGQANAGLQAKLGGQYSNYVNAYGTGGQFYDPQAISNANIQTPLWAQKNYASLGINPQQAAASQGNNGVTATSWSAPQVNGGVTPPPQTGIGNGLGGNNGGGGINPPPTTTGTGGTGAVDWSKVDVSKFMDPNVDYRIQKGTTAIQNGAAARGGLLSGNTLKGISDYANNEAGAAYANAQNAAFQDRNFMRGTFTNDRDYALAKQQWDQNFAQHQSEFNTGTDQADRSFFYGANKDDRNFNYQSLMDMAQMGQYGTSGNSNLMQSLARLLSANTIASGQAGAQGTLGGSNVIANIISQLMGQYSNNSWMSQLFPQGG